MDPRHPSTSKRPSLTGNTPASGDEGRILARLESGQSKTPRTSSSVRRKHGLLIAFVMCLLLLIAVPAYILLSHETTPLPSPVNASHNAPLPSVADEEDEPLPIPSMGEPESALILDEDNVADTVTTPTEPQTAEIAPATPPALPVLRPKQQVTATSRQAAAALQHSPPSTTLPVRPAAQQTDSPELLSSLIRIINQQPQKTGTRTTSISTEQPQSMDELVQQINAREQQNRRSNTQALERIGSTQSQSQAEKLRSQAQEALEKNR